MRFSRDSVAAMVATVVFLGVVILGFWKTRGPSTQRLIRGDERRLRNIYQLATQINSQYSSHGKELPAELNASQKTQYKDPVSGKPLEYYPRPPSGYTICAAFDTRGPKDEAEGAFAFWTHTAGRKCYEFEVGSQVPQIPYSDYY